MGTLWGEWKTSKGGGPGEQGKVCRVAGGSARAVMERELQASVEGGLVLWGWWTGFVGASVEGQREGSQGRGAVEAL